MNRHQIIFFRRVASALFLLLFLSIHFIKVVHQHDLPTVSGKDAKVLSSSKCSICDYHLAKDANETGEFAELNNTARLVDIYAFYNAPFVTSVGSTSSGRGPPSLS